MRYLPRHFIILLALLGSAPCAAQPAQTIVKHSVEAHFSDVYDSLTSAILGRGLNIAHVIESRTILAANEDAFGNGQPVFSSARNIEFCSARLSHQLVQENPDYLLLCPFAISVYELSGQPGRVHLAYRNPETISPGAPPAVLTRVRALLDGVIAESTQWFLSVPQE